MKKEKIHISPNEKLSLISNLSTMFSAGIPILEAVDALIDSTNKSEKKLLLILREDIMQGKKIHESLSRFPKVFDIVTVNIIKASEEAGTLDVALKDLKENIKKEIEFNDKLKSALVYPIFILAVFIAVLLMILIVVVPKIESVFVNLRTELPLPTQVLIFISHLLLRYPYIVIPVVGVGIGVLVYLYRRNKRAFLNAVFSLPIVSKLAEQIDLARFTHGLYLLLNSGLPITSALELSEHVVLKNYISNAIRNAKLAVVGGKKLSEGFKMSRRAFPGLMIVITEAGEKSGTLDRSMKDLSEYFNYQVDNALKKVLTLIEPLMLVLIGLLIGSMMLAIIAPIYGLIGNVGR